MDVRNILYGDLLTREALERKRLGNRLAQIDRSARSRLGGSGSASGRNPDPIYYSVEEKEERDRLERILKVLHEGEEKKEAWCDPLFVAARDLFNNSRLLIGRLGNPVGEEGAGLPGAELPGVALAMASDTTGFSAEAATSIALTLGLLILDAAEPPPLRVDETDAAANKSGAVANESGAGDRDGFVLNADRDDPRWASMSKAFFAAVGEAQSVLPLARLVLAILAREGGRVTTEGAGTAPLVDTEEFARVMRALATKGVTEHEPQLGRRVTEALDKVQNVGSGDGGTEIGIDLPDLEQTTDREIVGDNVRLMGPVICSAMLDELKAFQVVDRILESAQNGTLPIGRGNAGKLLYKRWREAPNRISEPERRNVYAMTMGQPGGDPSIQGNTEFNDLWLRFVSSVSSFVRQQDVDKLLRASLPSAIGAQQVRKAARDLASNLSLHGYGMTYYAALELQGEVKSMIQLLSDPEILSSYGARDMWQVIDQVATQDLGGARTASRYRTLATCGAIITAWLAENIEKIMRPMGSLIDMMDVRSPMPRTAGAKATTKPTDYDLVNACELWLADTATSDARVDEMSQPRESPVMTSKPVPVPAFAREFMDEIPGMGMSFNGGGRRNGSAARH